MIEVRSLTKSFGGRQALRGVDLTARPGSVYGLIGPNGAGKTTLLRCMAGVYMPDGGSIRCDGRPVFDRNDVKRELFFVGDTLFAYPGWTVRDARRFFGALYPAFDDALFNALNDENAPIPDRQKIAGLSKGRQKQLALRLGLAAKPRYLLLDEPLDGLDPQARRHVWQSLMDTLCDGEIHVIVSSHNLRELEDVCDTVGILRGGVIRRQGVVAELSGSMTKLQVSFRGGLPDLSGLPVLKKTPSGRVWELVLALPADAACAAVGRFDPLFCERLPLTLEELFLLETEDPDDE